MRVIIGCGGPLRTALSGGVWGADGGGDCCVAARRTRSDGEYARQRRRGDLPRTQWIRVAGAPRDACPRLLFRGRAAGTGASGLGSAARRVRQPALGKAPSR